MNITFQKQLNLPPALPLVKVIHDLLQISKFFNLREPKLSSEKFLGHEERTKSNVNRELNLRLWPKRVAQHVAANEIFELHWSWNWCNKKLCKYVQQNISPSRFIVFCPPCSYVIFSTLGLRPRLTSERTGRVYQSPRRAQLFGCHSWFINMTKRRLKRISQAGREDANQRMNFLYQVKKKFCSKTLSHAKQQISKPKQLQKLNH